VTTAAGVGSDEMQRAAQRELDEGLAAGKSLRQIHDEMNAPRRVAERYRTLRAKRTQEMAKFHAKQAADPALSGATMDRIEDAIVRRPRMTFEIRDRADAEAWIHRIAEERRVSPAVAASIFEREVQPLLESLLADMVLPIIQQIAQGGPEGQPLAFTGSIFAYDPSDVNMIAFYELESIVGQLAKSRGGSNEPLSGHEKDRLAALTHTAVGTRYEYPIQRFVSAWEAGNFMRLGFGSSGPHAIVSYSQPQVTISAPEAGMRVVRGGESDEATAAPAITKADLAALGDPAVAQRVDAELKRRQTKNPNFTLRELEAEVQKQ
jgi:hypothetical protein